MNRKIFITFTLLTMLFAACHKDDDESPVPEAEQKQSEGMQITVVFAPSQLGDMGYADGLLEALNTITTGYAGKTYEGTLPDVNYISPWDDEDTRQSIFNWAADTVNLFNGSTYSRRLLVLTEPKILPMLDTIKTTLRSVDEILALKISADDVKETAEKYSLGNRLHGLNISAARSIKRFCKFMKAYTTFQKESLGLNHNYDQLPLCRYYGNDYPYRDSIVETITDFFGESIRFSNLAFSTQGEGAAVFQTAYFIAAAMGAMYNMFGTSYAIIDLGAYNSGWDYWILGHKDDDIFQTLYIDKKESPLTYCMSVYRCFDKAFLEWFDLWMGKSVGEMPDFTFYNDENYCIDDIPLEAIEQLIELK